MRGRVAYAAFEAFPNDKGASSRMTQMLQALAEAGWEVHALTLPARAERAIPDGVVLHPLPAYAKNYLERALLFRAQVARRLRTLAPDMVHVRGVFEGWAAADYAEARGIPWIFEVNGLPSVELRYHYPAVGQSHAFELRLRQTEAALLGRASHVVTQSHTTLAFLRHRGLPDGAPATVIPNGADPDRWAPGSGEPERVLYAGTLAAWQGVSELLMALRRARRELPLCLTLAGPAPRRKRRQLERMIRRLGLQEAVEVTGPLGPEELAREVARARICVAPLRRDLRNRVQGCSPIKLYEYMAAAKAILSTDLPCVREILAPEETAALVHSPRPARLAEQLLRLAGDASLAGRLGARARAEVTSRGTWAMRREALAKVYATFSSCSSNQAESTS